MVKKIMRKKGLSPVITTVMLIALVIVIIAVLFFWSRGMMEEGVTKFGKNIKLVCEEVKFQADYQSGTDTLNIVNNGNIPIYNLNVKEISSSGSYTTDTLKKMDEGWPTTGLKQGETKSVNPGLVEDITSLELSPVLIGVSRSGKKTFVCGGDYGQKITI